MAIFSVRVSAHSRSKGESATGGAAYRLGLDLTNEQTGERHNYTSRQDIAAAFTLLPENAPQGWDDPARLWNEAEAAEKRKNSCVSREVLVALPAEMTDEQREKLARSIAGELVERYGVGLSVGIHRPDNGGINHHAHILMTTRRLGPKGLGEKTRELDDMKQGPAQVEAIRAMVAEQTNAALERDGYQARVDHRSLAEQRLEAMEAGDLDKAATLTRAPTRHRGRAPEMAVKVEATNRATAEANEHSQAEARAVFARLEADAASQARLMAPVADSRQAEEAKAKAEAVAREERQKQEREHMAERLKAAREAVEQTRQQQSEAYQKKQAGAMALEAHREGLKAYRMGITADKHQVAKEQSKIKDWKEEHAFRAWLGWYPEEITKRMEWVERLESRITKSAEAIDGNKGKGIVGLRKEEARSEKRLNGYTDRNGKIVRGFIADEARARKAFAQAQKDQAEAVSDRDAMKKRHAWDNLPEAERRRQLEEAAAKQAAYDAMDWSPNHLERRIAQEAEQRRKQTHEQRQERGRDRGWGMSM